MKKLIFTAVCIFCVTVLINSIFLELLTQSLNRTLISPEIAFFGGFTEEVLRALIGFSLIHLYWKENDFIETKVFHLIIITSLLFSIIENSKHISEITRLTLSSYSSEFTTVLIVLALAASQIVFHYIYFSASLRTTIRKNVPLLLSISFLHGAYNIAASQLPYSYNDRKTMIMVLSSKIFFILCAYMLSFKFLLRSNRIDI